MRELDDFETQTASTPEDETPAIVLPRSRKRKYAVPRSMMPGLDSHETLGNRPLTRQERADMVEDLAVLGPVRFGPPKDDRDCPTGPCPHVGCRFSLYIDVSGDRTILNWPGLHIDELQETCSLRAARAAAAKRQESKRPGDPAMSCAEIGRHLNLTAETCRKDVRVALAKMRAAGIDLGRPEDRAAITQAGQAGRTPLVPGGAR